MGMTKVTRHRITIGFASSNPVDSTEYRFVKPDTALTAPGLTQYLSFKTPGVLITKVFFCTAATADYSAEDVAISIKDVIAPAASTALGNMTKHPTAASVAYFNYTGALTYTNGQAIQMKMVTPAWATNPTGFNGIGFIEYIEL